MMRYKERHPLLLKCLITLIRYIIMIERAPERIYNPHMVHMVSFLPKTALHCYTEYQIFGTPHCTGNGRLCCKERHPLLLGWFMTFLRCMSMIGRAYDCIYKPLMVHISPLLQKQLSISIQYARVWVPLS